MFRHNGEDYISPDNAKRLVIMLAAINASHKSKMEPKLLMRVAFEDDNKRRHFLNKVTTQEVIDKDAITLRGEDGLLIDPAQLLNAYNHFVQPIAFDKLCKHLSAQLCYLGGNALARIDEKGAVSAVETCWQIDDKKSGLLKLVFNTLRKWNETKRSYEEKLNSDESKLVMKRVVIFLNANNIPYILRELENTKTYVIYVYAKVISKFYAQQELDIVEQIEYFAGRYANDILRSPELYNNFKKLLQIPGVLIGYPISLALRMQLLEFTRKQETADKKQSNYMIWLADANEIQKLTNLDTLNVENYQRRGIYFLVLNIKSGDATSQPTQLLLQFNLASNRASIMNKLNSNVANGSWNKAFKFTFYNIEQLIADTIDSTNNEKLAVQSAETVESKNTLITKFSPSLLNPGHSSLAPETVETYRSVALQFRQAHAAFVWAETQYRQNLMRSEPRVFEMYTEKTDLRKSSTSASATNGAETTPAKKNQMVRAFSGFLGGGTTSEGKKSGKSESRNSKLQHNPISASSDRNGIAPSLEPGRTQFRSGAFADLRDLFLLYQLTNGVWSYDFDATGEIILVTLARDSLKKKLVDLGIQFDEINEDSETTKGIAKLRINPKSLHHLSAHFFEERQIFKLANSFTNSETVHNYVISDESLLKANIQKADIQQKCIKFLNLFLSPESFANGVVTARNKVTGILTTLKWELLPESDVVGIVLEPSLFDYTKGGSSYALNVNKFHHWLNRLGLPCWVERDSNKPILKRSINSAHHRPYQKEINSVHSEKNIISMNISDVLFFIESCKLLESVPGVVGGVNLNFGEQACKKSAEANIDALDDREMLEFLPAVLSALFLSGKSSSGHASNPCEWAFFPSSQYPGYLYLMTSFSAGNINGRMEGPFVGVQVDLIKRKLIYHNGSVFQEYDFTYESVKMLVEAAINKLYNVRGSNLSLKPAGCSSVDPLIHFARIFHDSRNPIELETGCNTLRKALISDVDLKLEVLQEIYPPNGNPKSPHLALRNAANIAKTKVGGVKAMTEYGVSHKVGQQVFTEGRKDHYAPAVLTAPARQDMSPGHQNPGGGSPRKFGRY